MFKSLEKSTIILLGRHGGSPGIIALVDRMGHFISQHEIGESGVADRVISFHFPLISVACDRNVRLGVVVRVVAVGALAIVESVSFRLDFCRPLVG